MALKQAFESLDKSSHDIKAFDCGKPEMNQFLSRFAVKHTKLGLSHTWILVEETEATAKLSTVAAYYTLASATVDKSSLPIQKSLPRYPIPVVLLARLAIDTRYQGKGLGSKVLVAALRRAYELTSRGLPALGIVLDVLDAEALKFYQSFEFFEPLTDDPMRLFISMQSISDL